MPRFLATAPLALLLAACTVGPEYPLDLPGTWHTTGTSSDNLRAMMADPRDAWSGEAATTYRGNAGAQAVRRLYLERRRPLIGVPTGDFANQQSTQDTPLPGLDDSAGAAQPAVAPVPIASPATGAPRSAAPAAPTSDTP